MKIKTIAGVCFALAFSCLLLMLLENYFKYIPRFYLIIGLFGFGFTGFTLNLLNVSESPHRVSYSIIYWISMLLILIGLLFRLMHWPFATNLLLIGCGALGFSLLMPKKRSKETKSDDDLIDNF